MSGYPITVKAKLQVRVWSNTYRTMYAVEYFRYCINKNLQYLGYTCRAYRSWREHWL